MQKKTVIFLLLLSALLSVSSSCTEKEDSMKEQNTTQPTKQDTTAQADNMTETENVRASHSVPKTDFEGAVYNIGYTNWIDESVYIAQDFNGEVMNDAVYKRKMMIEEHLNINMTETDLGDITATAAAIKASFMADDDDYQQVMLHCITGVADLSSAGALYRLDELPVIDLDAEWWNQEKMELLQLGKHPYYVVSDYSIPVLTCMYFNKSLVADYTLDDPYKLVYDGKWTLDQCFDMAKAVASDINGNGRYDDGEMAGICGGNYLYIPFITGCNQYITEKNADGRVELSLYNEKNQNILEKLATAAKEPSVIIDASWNSNWRQHFANGNALFLLGETANFITFRDYEVDLGVLPYPKYDEAQENYQSLDWAGLTAISGTITNPELVGSVMELLAWDSKNEVIPTYYNVLLGSKLARDEQTVDMLDIMFDTVTYEVGGNYWGLNGAMNQLFYTAYYLPISQKSSDFASFYKKNEEAALKQIEQYYTALEATESN